MGEISPIPAKGLDQQLFAKFKNDLEFLLGLITQEEIGKKMGDMARSNINSYIKGTNPVTKAFINKFNEAWIYRINEERANLEPNVVEESPVDRAKEPTLADVMAILQRIESKIDRQAGPPDDKKN